MLLTNANTHAQCSDRYHKVDKNSNTRRIEMLGWGRGLGMEVTESCPRTVVVVIVTLAVE